jgi:hypothetical protein
MSQEDTELNEYIKELVLARLKSAPEGVTVSFGNNNGEPMSRDMLIKHVEQGDDIGKKMIQVQMKFLTSLKDGFLYE